MRHNVNRVAVVGTGPRGLAVALRLLEEHQRGGRGILLHLIDPEPGGLVWDPEQDAHLLMNSRGSQATVFADNSVPGVEGDSRGPSFIQWCRTIAATLPLPAGLAGQAAALTDSGFASRALFGHYTHWVLGQLAADTAQVRVHPHRAVDVTETVGGLHQITLDDPNSSVLDVDAVVLALGHLPMPQTPREIERASFAARHDLAYLPPRAADPGSLQRFAPAEPVAVLGAGLNFYDVMALLTEGRGGRFTPAADGALHYEASGDEPVLFVASGRGIPYMARAIQPQPVELRVLTEEVMASWLEQSGTLSFLQDVWPVIVREMADVWTRNGGTGAFDVDALGDPFSAAASAGILPPPVGSDQLTAVLRDILERDARSAAATPRGPATAVAESLAVIKDQVRGLVAAGAFVSGSIQVDLQGWFRSVGAFIAAGPPLRRVREAIALIDAGVLHALGAHARISLDEAGGTFLLSTRELPTPRSIRAVVEARLPAEDAGDTSDPLVRSLLESGLARIASLRTPDGRECPTAGLEVVRTTAATLVDATACRLVDRDGDASPRRFLVGLPVQPQEWNIANLPQPGRGDKTLTQAQSIAHQIALLPSAAHDFSSSIASIPSKGQS